MSPIAKGDLLDVLDAIDLENERLFRIRRAFVSKTGLDEATIEATAGFLAVMAVAFLGDRFDLDVQGVEAEPAFVIGALDAYEAIVDLIAWPIQRPAEVATFAGHVVMLGHPYLAGYRFADEPVPIFRTPARWLRAGGRGIVPIGPRASRALLDVDGPLLAEDDAHGAELAAGRKRLVLGASILVAERARRAA